jgi:CubicO group peptidase (beta-lactamase class C family)
MPQSWVELGLMRGAPPPPERLVTADNWIEGPFNRWGFLHVRELARTARIPRGDGPVRELPRDEQGLGEVRVAFEGVDRPLPEALDEAYVDGLCVVHDGRIAFERYVEGMAADDTHLLMSVSKSVTATLIGVLIEEDVVDPQGLVPDYIAALRGTSWEGCTVQHLLDMRAGIRFDEEDYANPDSDGVLIDEVSGYRPLRRAGLPGDLYAWISQMRNERAHGGPFRYQSILTDVLAWVAAEATGLRFTDLFAERIWRRLGAERDAEIIVDAAGFPAAEGGFCMTLRDFARFGQLHLEQGGGVLPAPWVARRREPSDELAAAFAGSELPITRFPIAFYHDCWWVSDAAAGIYSGYGINGQQLLIHGPTNTVIARFSTWPVRWDERLLRYADATNGAIIDGLS